MSDWWTEQIDILETTAEIFFELTSATGGGDSTQSDYKQFRASRLQLRFLQDLVTVIQFFLEKEKEHYARDHTATIRNGCLVHHFSELTDRSPEQLTLSASQANCARLSAIVRQLSFGTPSSLQQDGPVRRF